MSNTVNKIVVTQKAPSTPFVKYWLVYATVDFGSIAANATGFEALSVPGLDPNFDFVVGFNRLSDVDAHGYNEGAHIHDDVLHLWSHNVSGGSYNPASRDYVFIIGRMRG